jgi:predicted dehydrogenase
VASDWGIPAVYDDLEAMLEGSELDAVLNLTPIPVHYETSMRIVQAGRHLVTEKPLASTVSEANDLCAAADSAAVTVICAPFDMLAPEWAMARRLVQGGNIGRPAFARVQSSHAGPAAMSWPSDPTWFYQKGAGALLDMGVYGITRVTGVLGPAKGVTAMSGITAPKRWARGGPFDGLEIDASENDNTIMLLDFGNSTFAVVDATFNVVATKAPDMELFGSEGTLVVRRPDAQVTPNQLALEMYSLNAGPGLEGWVTPRTVEPSPSPDRSALLMRAVLVDHLVECLRTGKSPVTGAEHARHALEIMIAAKVAAREGVTVPLTTTFTV